jgi:hypothetical protein
LDAWAGRVASLARQDRSRSWGAAWTRPISIPSLAKGRYTDRRKAQWKAAGRPRQARGKRGLVAAPLTSACSHAHRLACASSG